MMGTGNRMTVGFVGIGTMGLPMAINLLRGGYSVKGYSRVPERNERFGEAGGTVCSSVEEVLSDVDVVITMVPNGSVVNDIVTRYKHRITPSTLFIDMSTTSPADARAAAEQLAEVGVDFLDLPAHPRGHCPSWSEAMKASLKKRGEYLRFSGAQLLTWDR